MKTKLGGFFVEQEIKNNKRIIEKEIFIFIKGGFDISFQTYNNVRKIKNFCHYSPVDLKSAGKQL